MGKQQVIRSNKRQAIIKKHCSLIEARGSKKSVIKMNCCVPVQADYLADPPETSLECDYDKNVTNLYDAIEKGAWDSVLNFLTTKKWSFVSFDNDPQSPEAQTRTWVTRFDPSGRVRWSQLPLHAAIIFHAPVSVIEALVDLYPLSVQCTDDQRMLPLHLAVRSGANDAIMNLLIRSFPEALVARNQSGALPFNVNGSHVRKDYTETIYQIVQHTTQRVVASQKKWSQQRTDNLEGTMEEQSELVKSLENDKDRLEHRLKKAKREISMWKKKCRDMEKGIMETGKKAKGGKSKDRMKHDETLGLLEQSRKLIELVSTFDNKNDGDTASASSSDSSSEEASFDATKHKFKDLRMKTKSANESVDSSVHLNSIDNNKVCWAEMRQHIYNTPNPVTRYERREMAPVTEGTNLQEDADICWNELRQTIYSSKEERQTRPSTLKKNKGDFVLQQSADKLLEIIPKDNEQRESPEKSVNPKRAITPKRSATPKPKRSTSIKIGSDLKRSISAPKEREQIGPKDRHKSIIPTKDLMTLRALRLERERRQAAATDDIPMIPTEIDTVNSSVKSRERGKSAERPISLLSKDLRLGSVASARRRLPDRNRWMKTIEKNSAILRKDQSINM